MARANVKFGVHWEIWRIPPYDRLFRDPNPKLALGFLREMRRAHKDLTNVYLCRRHKSEFTQTLATEALRKADGVKVIA